ncbi:MAG: sensor domain-containing diguanylate cyclase [Anaerohalosphaeraceae bacterium]|nr:sensor domain-containing diguanylate cyclase [Anaerohalosphaeraceae bacterium]
MDKGSLNLNASNDSQNSPNRQDLQKITPLVQQINCLDIKQIGKICIEELPQLVGTKYASLYILDEVSDMLHLENHNHPFLINNIVSLNQASRSPMIKAVRSKDLMVIENINRHKKPVIRSSDRQFSRNYESNSCIIAPLICQKMVVGVLNLADKIGSERFSDDDIALVELFRYLVGSSIGNIKLFEKTQHLAKTDGLTGLVNHRTFYQILETELLRHQRHGGQLSIIMVDIDNLKPVNDNYGHRAGDMVIKRVSRKIMSCIRNIDTAARYGGDEFAIILPSTSVSDALSVANRMAEAVSNSPIVWERHKIQLSISVGVGEYDGHMCPEEVTKFSDRALYKAKEAGKNIVKVFDAAEEQLA